jgi:hypothetical protein
LVYFLKLQLNKNYFKILMHKSHLQQVEDYVLSILTERTPIQNKYHSVAHTRDVVNSSIEIGIGEK